MAALPPPAAATEEADAEMIVDSDVWLACAVPLSRLPVVGSQVYYFPHGHAEQCPAPLPAALPTPHLFPCTVTAVRLDADAKTNEVYADISLQPGPHRGDSASSSSSSFSFAAQDRDAASNKISYYAKQLTQSDANNGGGFSVPRYCADFIFPMLDFEADPPVQTLLMRDTRGKQWRFRHIYRGTPRRHLLTTGWSKFVNAKLLVAGDTVVFMRRQDGELLIGLRRAPRYPMMMTTTTQQQQGRLREQAPLHNARARVPPEDVMEAARLAAEGSPFTVAYYPRLGAGEFVVPRKEVEEALACGWEPGMLVRMQVMEAEDARRTDWASGTVKHLHAHIWRPLEVNWDDSSSSSTKSRFLNGWQVQLAGYPPLLKRLRLADALCSGQGNDSMAAPPLITPPPAASQEDMAMLLGPPIPHAAAGMQGARHNGPAADVLLVASSSSPPMITTQLLFPSPVEDLSGGGGSSEILDPEFASPPSNSVNTRSLPAPVQTKSIQLFGTTITPHAAASEEANNEVPHGVLDENVEQQAS